MLIHCGATLCSRLYCLFCRHFVFLVFLDCAQLCLTCWLLQDRLHYSVTLGEKKLCNYHRDDIFILGNMHNELTFIVIISCYYTFPVLSMSNGGSLPLFLSKEREHMVSSLDLEIQTIYTH